MSKGIILPSEPIYFGGYSIVQKTPRPSFLDKDLTPEHICSLSDCLCEQFPGIYGLSWAEVEKNERFEWQKKTGLSRDQLKELVEEYEDAFEFENVGWGGVYQNLETARHFLTKYLKPKNWRILGIYTTASYCAELIESEKEAGQKNGQVLALEKEIILKPDVSIMGFDVLGFECGGAHSFLCNNLDQIFSNQLKINLNDAGLIDKWELAEAGSAYCNDPDNNAEPLFWAPWIITDETLEVIKS